MGILLCPYLLSQYLWFAAVFLLLLLTIPMHSVSETKDFFTATDVRGWETTSPPHWFLHTTNLHLSSTKRNYDDIFDRLQAAVDIIKPEKLLISGDVTYNCLNTNFRPCRHMIKEDWDLYKKLLEELDYSKDDIIAVAGAMAPTAEPME